MLDSNLSLLGTTLQLILGLCIVVILGAYYLYRKQQQ